MNTKVVFSKPEAENILYDKDIVANVQFCINIQATRESKLNITII